VSKKSKINIHRCAWVENPGEGVPEVFAKIPRGVKAFRKKMIGGVPLFRVIAFLLTGVLKFAWGGTIFTLPLPLVCIHVNIALL
jgi:hypothetical protein